MELSTVGGGLGALRIMAGMEPRKFATQVGARIKEEREKRGMSTRDLARKITVTRQYVYTLEDGDATPGFAILWKICKAFNLSWNDILPAVKKSAENRAGTLVMVPLEVAASSERRIAASAEAISFPVDRIPGWLPELSDRFVLVSVAPGELALSRAGSRLVVAIDREPTRDESELPLGRRTLWISREGKKASWSWAKRTNGVVVVESATDPDQVRTVKLTDPAAETMLSARVVAVIVEM